MHLESHILLCHGRFAHVESTLAVHRRFVHFEPQILVYHWLFFTLCPSFWFVIGNPFGKPQMWGAGTCGIWGHREEVQKPLHETMRLAEAQLVRHVHAEACHPKLWNTVKYRVEEMHPKWPFWKHHVPKMRLVEVQCPPPEALPPQNPSRESSHFSGLTICSRLFQSQVVDCNGNL